MLIYVPLVFIFRFHMSEKCNVAHGNWQVDLFICNVCFNNSLLHIK